VLKLKPVMNMENNERKVPRATLQRYPVYLKALRKLKQDGVDRIMSRQLADYVGIESTTIRRDFSFLGNLGKQGYGYNVDSLIQIFSDQLGVSFDEKIILIGAGNLGRALLNYNHWNHVVGEIVCAFDLKPENVKGSWCLSMTSRILRTKCRRDAALPFSASIRMCRKPSTVWSKKASRDLSVSLWNISVYRRESMSGPLMSYHPFRNLSLRQTP
jgi:hypothetical protein